jgi:hypothetical protein
MICCRKVNATSCEILWSFVPLALVKINLSPFHASLGGLADPVKTLLSFFSLTLPR